MPKLFTFSGIRAGFGDLNDGKYLVKFAEYLLKSPLWPAVPAYAGTDDTDHFRSYVNFDKLFADFDNILRLDGSEVLNREAREKAPLYGTALWQNSGQTEDLVLLAHSQGTNNVTHALLWLEEHQPSFFSARRKIRLLMFDPKVGVNYISALMGSSLMKNVRLSFFQSENNLLGNQNVNTRKFIDEFENGDHVFVMGLNHSTIVDSLYAGKNQRMLTLPGYRKWRREVSQKVLELQRRYGSPLRGVGFSKMRAYVRDYTYLQHHLEEAILEFAIHGKFSGKLAEQSLFA